MLYMYTYANICIFCIDIYLSNLWIFQETAMGIQMQNIDKSEQKQYLKAIHDIGEIIVFR